MTVKFFNPVLNRDIHEQLAEKLKQAMGRSYLAHRIEDEDDDEFLQTIITMRPILPVTKGEYQVIAELSALLYCSQAFYPEMAPLYPGFYPFEMDKLRGLIDGKHGDYLTLRHPTLKERIFVDLDMDTSYLEAENYYTIYLTLMTKA